MSVAQLFADTYIRALDSYTEQFSRLFPPERSVRRGHRTSASLCGSRQEGLDQQR